MKQRLGPIVAALGMFGAVLGVIMFSSPATGVSRGDRIVFLSYFAAVSGLLWWGRTEATSVPKPRISV